MTSTGDAAPWRCADRLEDEAARRGIAVEALVLDVLPQRYGIPSPGGHETEEHEGFLGCLDSGDPTWAGTDTHILRGGRRRSSSGLTGRVVLLVGTNVRLAAANRRSHDHENYRALLEAHRRAADWHRVVELVDACANLRLDAIDASTVAVAERLAQTTIATLDHRDFRAVRPTHCDAFALLPADETHPTGSARSRCRRSHVIGWIEQPRAGEPARRPDPIP